MRFRKAKAINTNSELSFEDILVNHNIYDPFRGVSYSEDGVIIYDSMNYLSDEEIDNLKKELDQAGYEDFYTIEKLSEDTKEIDNELHYGILINFFADEYNDIESNKKEAKKANFKIGDQVMTSDGKGTIINTKEENDNTTHEVKIDSAFGELVGWYSDNELIPVSEKSSSITANSDIDWLEEAKDIDYIYEYEGYDEDMSLEEAKKYVKDFYTFLLEVNSPDELFEHEKEMAEKLGLIKKESKLSDKAQEFISKKISILMNEGYSQDQATAIAYDMAREKGFDVPEKKTKSKKETSAWLKRSDEKKDLITYYDEYEIQKSRLEDAIKNPFYNEDVYDTKINDVYLIDIMNDSKTEEEFWKKLEELGISKDDVEEKVEERIFEDIDYLNSYWEDEADYLTSEINRFNPSGNWLVKGHNIGWRNLEGYKYFSVDNGQELINKITPDTNFSFYLYDKGDHWEMIVYHHDSPTGETYDLYPIPDISDIDLSLEQAKKYLTKYEGWKEEHFENMTDQDIIDEAIGVIDNSYTLEDKMITLDELGYDVFKKKSSLWLKDTGRNK